MCYRFVGLIFEGAYFRNFTVVNFFKFLTETSEIRTIKQFQTNVCCFFVAVGIVVGRKLVKSTFFHRFVRENVFPQHNRFLYKVTLRYKS